MSINCLHSIAQDGTAVEPATEGSISHDIHLTSKFIVKDNKILLQWHAPGKNGFYIIERSPDEKSFDVIGVIKARTVDNQLEFIDEKPLKRKNYYRIKMQGADEKDIYSDTTAAGTNDSIFCKFYPNPVDKLLILRSDYSAGLKITDFAGNIRIIQQIKPGLQILDVSCLEKNIYFITIFLEESNQVITKKLMKN